MTEHHTKPRLLITAGPTQEPIDAVRYLGNRSSGRLGVLLADRAAARGWAVTLLLGPTHLLPQEPAVEVVRFRTTTELGELLKEHQPGCRVLVMAAAVADFRPVVPPGQLEGKLKRSEGSSPLRGERSMIELEPTEDLLAACSARREAGRREGGEEGIAGQLLVGFALEPRERMLESARAKLERKGIDLIVANPLGTMESEMIEAVVLGADGSSLQTEGAIGKGDFADWLLGIVEEAAGRLRPERP